MTQWFRYIKADAAAFFLNTILEIPRDHIPHLDFEEKELTELINKYSEDIDQETFIKVAEKVTEGNTVDMTTIEEWHEQYDGETHMYHDQKAAYEEAISILMDALYKISNESKSPEPEPKPKKHKSRVFPREEDWRKNLKIIQAERRKKKRALGPQSKRSKITRPGGAGGYGGALVGQRSKVLADKRTFRCLQCGHTRAGRHRVNTDSRETICTFCNKSNIIAEETGKTREGSGGDYFQNEKLRAKNQLYNPRRPRGVDE